jgi:hypothetical protein
VIVYGDGMDILAGQLAQARVRGAVFSVLRRLRPGACGSADSGR